MSVLSKSDHQKQVDKRVLEVAEMYVGRNKKFVHYKDFYETINFPIGSLASVLQGTRHFTMYNVWMVWSVYGINGHWLLTGEGIPVQKEQTKLEQLEKRLLQLEKKGKK